jgi:hypothetical protein
MRRRGDVDTGKPGYGETWIWGNKFLLKLQMVRLGDQPSLKLRLT